MNDDAIRRMSNLLWHIPLPCDWWRMSSSGMLALYKKLEMIDCDRC